MLIGLNEKLVQLGERLMEGLSWIGLIYSSCCELNLFLLFFLYNV